MPDSAALRLVAEPGPREEALPELRLLVLLRRLPGTGLREVNVGRAKGAPARRPRCCSVSRRRMRSLLTLQHCPFSAMLDTHSDEHSQIIKPSF